MKKLFVITVLVLAAGGGTFYFRHSSKPAVSYKKEPVKCGDLVVTIGATGTIEPEEVVDVGAQVAGKIEMFGTDPNRPGKPIDYGTQVEVGTVLAHIDESMYTADVEQALAQLEQAKANVARTVADLEQMKAKLRQAENNWKRAQELGPSRALSATDFDSYRANYETAKATLAVGEATIEQARKSVVQSEAALKRSKTNLGYCTIRSPVKGVIIDRRVNIGQTVVASLNAPSLFLIAKDLRKMQVWASVNEADIGSIHPGQGVSFTVDAFPGKTFRGVVGKIRLNATMTQNVVTYTVEINTDNADGKLLPYLTANLRFEIAQPKNVLQVPNAALRWVPSADQVAPDVREEFLARQSDQPKPGQMPRRSDPDKDTKQKGYVWIQAGPWVQPIPVVRGLTDGTFTEIQSDNLTEGTSVIVGEVDETAGRDETTNPFAPKLFGRPRT